VLANGAVHQSSRLQQPAIARSRREAA